MTASVQKKSNKYYVVLSWYTENGKRQQKWINTNLTVNGNNKRRAEQKKLEILREYENKINLNSNDILFSDYLKQWLEDNKVNISNNTYYSYRQTIYNSICPYFAERKFKLIDLKPYHIQDFYNYKMNTEGLSANSIYHYHANIHKALDYAVKTERIKDNPSDKISLPKKEKHIAEYYTLEELKTLLEVTKGTTIEAVVYLAVWFGLRRGEIIGLKWDFVDFENKRLTIAGTITDKGASGSRIKNLSYCVGAKTKSSVRAFPLSDDIVNYLKHLKEKQVYNQTKPNYNFKWSEFVCVRDNGDLIPLDYVTRTFARILKNNHLKPITFHELRHSNISLLLENGASMKEAQEWAGHSSYSTTANIYAHVQAKNKEKLTQTIQHLLF